ncbi:hypothetical protein SAMN04487857_107175 [Pseudomonas sp. ok272]|uniref:hypothetical protein n=1 Tax=unclassified Pseudomonas TaxID=196821 RepID=UPI0008C348FF|nr:MULTISPECIES: hypothetical protein [unclassified Pseudomonas]SEM95114.1 hypothetical protein SAMN04487857_107175 [Pseudomonas sp. ok272]SFM93257.1 hypothetical protein SAMN04487858_10941 [Pseudomonas sp. ok602]
MTIYEDEYAYWDDISGKFILKHASNDIGAKDIIEAAAYYADEMILQRRKRKRAKNPE